MAITVSLLNEKSSVATVVGAARTCYSGKGPVVLDNEGAQSALSEKIRVSTLQAGHNTTRLHGAYTFVMDGVSRHMIWSFLHSHPFYNSEQVSQRYVEVKKDNFIVPEGLTDAQRIIFDEGVQLTFGAYKKLQEMLRPRAEEAYYTIFPIRKKNVKKEWESTIQKRTQEVARYILPLAATSYLYHTLSPLTLMRLYQCADHFNVPQEQKKVVQMMVDQVCQNDPLFELELKDLKKYSFEESLEYKLHQELSVLQRKGFVEEFDSDLCGMFSVLIGYDEHAENNLARAVRSVLQVSKENFSDENALDILLNPRHNTVLGDTNNVMTLTRLGSAMSQVTYTFMKKLSHTGDSQNQRHRMTPETMPIFCLSDVVDVVLPSLIEEVPVAKEYFMEQCNLLWGIMGKLRESGASEEVVQYLAPNAVAIRFMEQGDLRNLHHKYRMRLCYNAQEEIWRSSVEEVQQIKTVHPLIGKYLLPPCTIRYDASFRPVCPEGSRYCGVQVWKLDVDEYVRSI
jgi:thymidylate synthase ThyX